MYVVAAVAVICLVCLAIIARNWSCRKKRDPRPPRIETVGPYEVLSAETGASLKVKISKRRDRQVILDMIAAPAEGNPFSSASADNLRKLAGKSVTVQYERRGLFRSSDGLVDGEVQPEADGAEARGILTGIVFGGSGINLNLAQVEAGYARCHDDGPKEWEKAEAKAKKLGFGIWSEAKE